ncbi:MAG TPA: ATP synthase F1 subunit gamma [Sphingobacteriaceae bacterium]|nr:ATP synthase F1 subunit gamma [Sphingobacteriaceae bacterium]
MASLRDIRRRRRAVENIKQITRAMYLVASAKMRRTEDQVRSGQPYARKLNDLLGRLAREEMADHPLLVERPVKRSLVVVVTGDRGLAGSYNHNVNRRAEEAVKELEQAGTQVDLYVIGRRGRDYFRRRGYPIKYEVTNLGEEIAFLRARSIARELMDLFMSDQFDEIKMVYTSFVTVVTQDLMVTNLLPLGKDVLGEMGAGGGGDEPEDEAERHLEMVGYIYEPDRQRVFDDLLPKSVEIRVYRMLLEAKASEYAFRMRAMKNATDNAEELIASLTMAYNRARQASITAEIADIVGGAEALRGRV